MSTAVGAGSAGGGGAMPSSGWSVSSSSSGSAASSRVCSSGSWAAVSAPSSSTREQDRRDVVVAAAAVRGLDQRLRAGVRGRRGAARMIRSISSPSTISTTARRCRSGRRRPAAATTANVSTSTSGSVPSARVITERCGCTSRLGGRQLAAPHELGDERVVVGQLLELVVAQEVRARVADVAEDDAAVGLDERDRHRRAHAARSAASVRRAVVDAPVRLLDQLRRRAARRRRSRPPRAARPAASAEATSPACAPPMPSAIAKSGGCDDVRVLVAAPLAPGVRAALRSRPIFTARTSGRSRRCGRRRRASACGRASAGCRSRTCRSSSRCPRSRRRRGAARSARGASRRTRRRAAARRCCCRGRRSAAAQSSEYASPSSSAGLASTTSRPSSRAVGCGIRPAAAACCGARIIDSCGSRRSRAAERTIRQMKR